ncbi:ubiquitin carboxyl-terminal hydrolase 10-like [Sorex fumeus]|uniref:ubiquitin carboxyl-terminal hydrolase 10-like n=1 Tax=Sorex fumeus TaxID=62283 RepID=UPI0024AD8566|nr:ubiquitin carboxyl-terminal hydrolase 10-like [Sorex fumeus]
MALPKLQLIFGDFTPDEYDQFFMTHSSSVELPPLNMMYMGDAQAVEPDGPEHPEDQRTEFGVNEVTDHSDTPPRTPDCSVSSTLTPQESELIQSCTTSRTTPENMDKEVTSNSTDCQETIATLAVESPSNAETECLENKGTGERQKKRKKKKRPPSYYSSMKDDGDGTTSSKAPANPAAMCSVGPKDAKVAEDFPPSLSPSTSRSPQESTDLISDAVPGGSLPGGQPKSVLRTDFEQSCHPAKAGRDRDNLLSTTGAQPSAESDTTEKLVVDKEQICESSGEGSAAKSMEFHTVKSIDLDLASAKGTPISADVQKPAMGAVPLSQPTKLWASLFYDTKPSSSLPVASKHSSSATSSMVSKEQVEVKEGMVPLSEDSVALEIAELLENVTLVHTPVSLQPRGLINKGNWSYINATLQAIVACPPMYHLMKFIPLYSKVQRPYSSTPMIDGFVQLMNEFTSMPIPSKSRETLGNRFIREIHPGIAFEPTYIYHLFTVIKANPSKMGRQEDAEECLDFILNGLHEEMLALKKLLSPDSEKLILSNGPKGLSVNQERPEVPDEGSDDEWEQVGPRNKRSVKWLMDFVQTPITSIFGGHIRSVVYQQSFKDSATLQLFFTLQLDIQSDKIHTVQDALESLVAREYSQGYSTKTKQEVEISRRVTLEKLPPVLVLHLKRFVYKKTGECQKILKNIYYPIYLEISKELLSPGAKHKNSKSHRTYKLFAVIYHHGSSATGIHYTTDIFQMGLNNWLHIDDQRVQVVNQCQVVKPVTGRTAYLLYYQRVDLL